MTEDVFLGRPLPPEISLLSGLKVTLSSMPEILKISLEQDLQLLIVELGAHGIVSLGTVLISFFRSTADEYLSSIVADMCDVV